jgi:hypothetical protein
MDADLARLKQKAARLQDNISSMAATAKQSPLGQQAAAAARRAQVKLTEATGLDSSSSAHDVLDRAKQAASTIKDKTVEVLHKPEVRCLALLLTIGWSRFDVVT